MSTVPSQEIGATIPNFTPHAVSVTLPTWEATVGYEKGEDWVVSKMHSGYPRFFIHSKIQELCTYLENRYGREGEKAFVFGSYNVARRCREFVKTQASKQEDTSIPNVRILQLSTMGPQTKEEEGYRKEVKIAVVFLPLSHWKLAKAYWQHSGEGISSRMGEYVLQELKLSAKTEDCGMFIEERFGRNLDLRFADESKIILRKRIAGKLGDVGRAIDESDVFLYPSGMASIFNAHLALLGILEPQKSVCFGFPYVDTLNILKKFGPGVHFYGFGDDDSLIALEEKLSSGEKILGFFCECPSNPLLRTPNLRRIRELANTYKFPIVVDETVGNFLNIDVLKYADVVVSSLTKVFSGDSNVMAGSLVLNPQSPYYQSLKSYFASDYEDLFWPEDAIYLERNSRDFEQRSSKVNATSEAVVDLFLSNPLIKDVFYPKILPTKPYYDDIKTPNGGYGGLISLVFHKPEQAKVFFNEALLSKGPSLGTNFTIACPYTILAHFEELEEVEQWGVDPNLVRLSVGLEDKEELIGTLSRALNLAALAG